MTSLTVGGSYELCVNGLNLPAPIRVLDKARAKLKKRGVLFKDDFDYLADVDQVNIDDLRGGNIFNDKLLIMQKDGKHLLDREAMLDTTIVKAGSVNIPEIIRGGQYGDNIVQ